MGQTACDDIARGDDQAFIFIDGEFYLKASLSAAGGRFGGEEGLVVLVHPKHGAFFLFGGGQAGDARRAAGVENQLDRLGIHALALFAQLVNGDAQVLLFIIGGFNGQACDRFAALGRACRAGRWCGNRTCPFLG